MGHVTSKIIIYLVIDETYPLAETKIDNSSFFISSYMSYLRAELCFFCYILSTEKDNEQASHAFTYFNTLKTNKQYKKNLVHTDLKDNLI